MTEKTYEEQFAEKFPSIRNLKGSLPQGFRKNHDVMEHVRIHCVDKQRLKEVFNNIVNGIFLGEDPYSLDLSEEQISKLFDYITKELKL